MRQALHAQTNAPSSSSLSDARLIHWDARVRSPCRKWSVASWAQVSAYCFGGRGRKPGGLQFPSGDTQDHADYWDFVYFSFVIGMTAQVSDVGITDKIIRRTATVHGIISFVFNTALLALMVNIAASAI